MFRKLLKYDLKYIWRIWWILATVIATLTVPAGLMARQLLRIISDPLLVELSATDGVLMFFSVISIPVYVFVLCATFIVTELLCYWRFYQNCYSDQGYLTFTLPISRRMLLFSKLVNHAIWISAHFLLILLSLFFALWIAWGGLHGVPSFLSTLKSLFATVLPNVSGWSVAALLLSFLLSLLSSLFFSASVAYFFITLGAVIFKKLKLLGAFGLYYLTNWLFSGVLQLISSFGSSILALGAEQLLRGASTDLIGAVIAISLLLTAVITAAIGSIFYCVTQILMDRKLNLA